MKKFVIVLGVVAVVALLVFSQRTTILTRMMEKGLETRLNADATENLVDGLHLALCGSPIRLTPGLFLLSFGALRIAQLPWRPGPIAAPVAPEAIAEVIERYPLSRPITSMMKVRPCAVAVSAMRSQASTIVFIAVSTPIAKPVSAMSLSMDAGIPMH